MLTWSKDHPSLNTLVTLLPGASRVSRAVHGCYLVVKLDRDGVARDVVAEDVPDIEAVVVQ